MAKKTTQPELRVSRADFYRLRGQEFFEACFKCIDGFLGDTPKRDKRWDKLNRYQQGLYAWWCFWGDVENGGLAQYFYNFGDALVPALQKLLKESGNNAMIPLVTDATRIYRKHKKAFLTDNPWGEDGLFTRMTELQKMDRKVVGLINRTNKQLEKRLRANFALIAVGDTAKPIDPKFTGEIETLYPNGKIHEQATIRRGVLSGPYRRYFDDGVLEHSCYYAAGEISSDFWPNGQVKRRITKRDKLKIYEWYFPSGKLQKRYVANKDGFPAEPIRVWHENGQLAEELKTRNDRKTGPWLKFFDDGSPRLQAEYGRNETLIVHNAWDDERRQVVKDGRGVYLEDGLSIDWEYDVYHEHAWIRSYELDGGIPNGESITWSDGVLWSKETCVNGKTEGTLVTYYDNGRIRSQDKYRNGKEVGSKDFPKFDNPRPAVIVNVEADEAMYSAWQHPLLDVYPKARNLDAVQAKIAIPAFLQEVFERNLTNAIQDDYEDLNTFDDSIGYFVMLDERGNVESANWTGCGVYSGGSVDVYPPIIQKLKFEPGQIRGRKVRCRVYVNIAHTFVEGEAKS